MRQATLHSALLLSGIVCVAVVLLATTWALTRPGIETAAQALLRTSLQQVLDADRHDNDLAVDRVRVRAVALGGDRMQSVYRARQGETPVALILTTTAADGYSGAIDLLVACDAAGRTLGVRVMAHRETPGLGDAIEAQRSEWIHQFDDLPLAALSNGSASPEIDGGVDLISGATITTRTVTEAVHRTVVWARQHRKALFETPRGRTLKFPRPAPDA